MNHPFSRRRGVVPRRALAAVTAAVASVGFASTAQAYDAEITRTTGGIPHIKAGNLADAGYGVGYAAAQDNLCTLADTIITARGERARYYGTADTSTMVSDAFFTWNRESGNLERRVTTPVSQGGPSDQSRAMVAGYVAGYNQYLEDRGGRNGITDPRCRGAAHVKSISTMDMWAVANMLGMRASSNNLMSAIVGAGQSVPTPADQFQASRTAGRSGNDALADQITKDLEATVRDEGSDPTRGSNAVGAGKAASKSGNSGVVLGNPHFPWAGNERFWEFGIEVPGVVKSIGAGLMGSPVPNIGHNAHVAWSHTVSTARRFTFNRLALAPNSATTYLVDGVPKQMMKHTIKVNIAGAIDRAFDIYSTDLGPVMINPGGGMNWTTSPTAGDGNAWVLHDPNADNLRLFDQWLAMNQAGSAQELVDSQKRIQGIPWVNTIGADDQGNAFYTDQSVVPNVPANRIAEIGTTATGCLAPGTAGQVAAANYYVLMAHLSRCLPVTDADSAAPGIFGGANLPDVITTNYVQNANDSYWLSTPDSPITGFSSLMGPTGVTQSARTRAGIQMIRERLAGTDGQPGSKFSLETMKGLWTAHRSIVAEDVLDELVTLCNEEKATTPAIAAACPILASYDATGKRDSKGGWLFSRWYALAPTSTFWAVPFDAAHPDTTPRGLNVSAGTPRTAKVNALVSAINELNARGVALDASHGDVQYTERNGEKIRIPGCNTGCYPVISVSTSASDYGRVITGNSFVMFAEMSPSGPRAQALLSYSQSEDPTSPYYADQTKRFSNLDFIDLPFTAAAIEAQKLSRITIPAKPAAPQPQPQPNPQPQPQNPAAPAKPVTRLEQAELSLSSKKGLRLFVGDFGGRELRSAKLTLPKGWSIDKKKAKKKSHLKVTTKSSKTKVKTTPRTITITSAAGGENLRIKSSKSLIRKTSKSKKKRTVTVTLTLTFTDGSKQTQKLKVRAS